MTQESKEGPDTTGRLGHFIQNYSGFLSSFVIGLAGLIATSIWQYRQSKTAELQADAQLRMQKEKADSDWKIARAEILAKNLDVLASPGKGNADRRFGVLLSLTRGDMIDAELAVSYALELGRDNPGYMRTVLASTRKKNYPQLAQAFALTCLQRFGVEKAVEICKDDELRERSDAIAELVQEELEAQTQIGADWRSGPASLLLRESEVQDIPTKLAWLFEPYLQDLYEHRRWKDIERFESWSEGARLVAALVLATARTGELLSGAETQQVEKLHADHRRWLTQYLLDRRCDQECRAQLVGFMLATVQESRGDYDETLKDLLLRPRAEVGKAVVHMHTRLLWCQIDPQDAALLRDQVLVPAAGKALAQPPREPVIMEDLVGLLALAPAPTGDPKSMGAFNDVLAKIRGREELHRIFTSRQARAQRQRANPPPMVQKVNLCGAPAPDDPQK